MGTRKPPAKGATVTEDLGKILDSADWAGTQVTLRHVGPVAARGWGYQRQRIRLLEIKRLAALREGLTEEQAPSLFGVLATPEGMQELEAFAQDILTQTVAGVEGSEDPMGLLAYLTLEEQLLLANRCVELQSLTHAEVFS